LLSLEMCGIVKSMASATQAEGDGEIMADHETKTTEAMVAEFEEAVRRSALAGCATPRRTNARSRILARIRYGDEAVDLLERVGVADPHGYGSVVVGPLLIARIWELLAAIDEEATP